MSFNPSRIIQLQKIAFIFLIPVVFIVTGTCAGLFLNSPGKTNSVSPDSIQSNQTKKDTTYNEYIRVAELLFQQKNYQKAMSAYQNALRLKPGDSYANLQIGKINTILKSQAVQAGQYEKIIASADKYFADKDYFNAKASYQLALDAKPDDLYARGKLQECMERIRANKASNILYDVAIANADKYFQAKEYQKALEQYESAAKILPGDKVAKDRINQIIKIMVDIEAREEAYKTAIQNGDKFYQARKYQNALLEYKNALVQKPEEKYPQERIAELNDLLAKLKDSENNYKKALASADQLFNGKEYEKARPFYEEASKIKPAETYPPSRIREIESILAASKKAAADYDRYIAAADSFYVDKKYLNAKYSYELALKVKPDESYPKEMISKAENLLAGQAANEKNIEEAKRLAARQKFITDSIDNAEKARKAAEEALALKQQRTADSLAGVKKAADEALALKQQRTADSLAAAKKTADAALAAKLKADAEAKLIRDKFIADSIAIAEKAREEAEAALAAKKRAEEEALAQKQKREGDSIAAVQQALAAKKLREADSIAAAEVAIAAAKQAADLALLAKQKKEADSIAAAQAAFAARQKRYNDSLASAKKAEKNALALRQKQISDSIAGAKAAFALRQKQISDSIASAKKAADEALALRKQKEADSIAGAKAAFALRQKQISDSIASAKKAADEALALRKQREADSLATVKRLADEALAAKKKSDAEKALNDKYNLAIGNADRLLAAKTYDQAKAAYNNALSLKPDEQYPKEKIAAIDQTLADITKAKQLDDQYKAAVAKADQLYNGGSLAEARDQYVAALALKPTETYPAGKISSIEKTLSDQKAIDEKYTAAIASADKLMGEKSYDEAKTGYQAASQLKPAQSYPRDQIALIDKTLAEIARQKTVDDKYNVSIAKADKLFSDKNYSQARIEYGNSQSVKPSETYPKDRIAEIDAIVAELRKKDEEYTASVSKANGLLAQKAYEDARREYEHAGEIKPDEQFPKTKIQEINKLLTELKGKKQTFDDLVLAGDNNFASKNYKLAKESYRQALDIFPDQDYPKQRVARITAISDSIYRTNKSFYDKAVADGDKALSNLVFDKAIDAYTEASAYLPDENYPRDMILKIKKTISENAMVDVLTSSTIIKGGAETSFPFPTVNISNRKNNYVYIKIRNLSDKPFNVLLRYGKDKQISGGAVIRNLESDGQMKDRLISFRDQDPWYRIDNNYISLYPQGGDVEVTFIQISRAAQQ